jgi:PEP-CTERM motif-containing protein
MFKIYSISSIYCCGMMFALIIVKFKISFLIFKEGKEMKKKLIFLCAVMFVFGMVSSAMAIPINNSSDPALTGANVIGFEDQVLGLYTDLTIDDVTFTGNNGTFQIDSVMGGDFNTSGIYLENELNGFNSFTFSFSSTVTGFGFNWGASNEDWELTAYDASDNFLESYTLPQVWWDNNGEFYGIATANIAYATLIQTTTVYDNPTDWILIDNFTYQGSEPVPEPSTILLMGAGLLGLVGYNRKRFSKKC